MLLPQLGLQLQDSSTFTESQKGMETGEVVTTGQLNFNPQEQLKQQEQKAKPAKELQPCEVRIFSLIILVFTTALFATVHTQLRYCSHYFQEKPKTGGELNQEQEGNPQEQHQEKLGKTESYTEAVVELTKTKTGGAVVELTKTKTGDLQKVVDLTQTPTPEEQKCPKLGQGRKVRVFSLIIY